jgi:hypothetical protein
MCCYFTEELLASHPTPTLEDHPVSAVCDFLFSVSVSAIPISFIRNLRARQAAVTTGNHPLSWSLESDLGDSIVAMTTASPVNFGEISDAFFLSGSHFFYSIH